MPHIQTLSQFLVGHEWRRALYHTKSVDLLIWVARGQGRIAIHGKSYNLSPHSALFIPAQCLRAITGIHNAHGTVVAFPQNASFSLPNTPHHIRLRDVQSQSGLTVLFDAMTRDKTVAVDTNFQTETAHAHASLLSVWLRRTLVSHTAQSTVPPVIPTSAQRVTTAYFDLLARDFPAYIAPDFARNTDISPPLSNHPIADYAAALNVTATHLSRCCKSCTDQNAAAIFMNCRLYMAHVFIETTDHKIGRIAAHLGFQTPAYFSRFVQKHTQNSPSELRKSANLHARAR